MRIRTRILLAVLFVAAIATGVYSQFVIKKERSDALARLQVTIADTDRLLGIVLARPLYDGDVAQLNVLLDSFFQDSNLTGLVLREHRGDIHLQRSREPARALGTTLASKVPVMRGTELLGEVRSTYSTAGIEVQLLDSRRGHIMFSLSLMLGLLVVTFFVAAGLARPIARLDSVAQATAQGDWSQNVAVGGARELVSLGESFARMRDAIQQKMAALTEANDRLRQEIEERKHAQQDVARLVAILEATPDFVCSADSAGRILHVNRAGMRLLGREEDEDPSRLRIPDFHSPEMARFIVEEALPATLAQGLWRGETSLRHQQGHDIPVLQVFIAHKNQAGELEYYSTIARDITERKRAEAELQQRENRLAFLLTSMPAVIYACRPDGDFGATFVSGNVESQLGHRPSEFTADPEFWVNRIHPDDRARVLRGLGAVMTQDSHVHEYRFHHRNGTFRWMRDELRLVRDASGRPAEIIGCWSDITERKRAEDALRESEVRYRLLFESNPHPMWVYDLDTLHFLAVNDAAVAHYGYSHVEFLAMTIKDIRPREDLPRLLDNLRQVRGGLDEAGVWRHLKKNGEVIAVEITSHTLPFGTRRAELVLANDISKRLRAEAALRESEERLRLAITAANQGLYDLNVQTGEATVSREYATMLGYDPATFRETNSAWIERLHPDDRERVSAAYRDYVAGKVPLYQVEFRQRTAAGDWKWVLSLGKMVQFDAAGQPLRMLGTHTDITDRKRAELAQHAALEEKEALLREVHHRVKNNLQIVSSLLSLKAGREQNKVALGALQDTQARVRAIALLHERLYRSTNLAWVELGPYLEELCAQLARAFGQGVRPAAVQVRIPELNLGMDQAVPCGLIVSEAVTNAYKHAFEQRPGGRIEVSARCSQAQEVELIIADNGVGLPPGFVPDRATTLGLQLVSRLTRQVDGRLQIESGPTGTRLTVTFPLLKTAGTGQPPAAE